MEKFLVQVIPAAILLFADKCKNFLVQVNPSEVVILLADAEPRTCGAKAAACGRLSSLSEDAVKGEVCQYTSLSEQYPYNHIP